jgi:hypothetical protein
MGQWQPHLSCQVSGAYTPASTAEACCGALRHIPHCSCPLAPALVRAYRWRSALRNLFQVESAHIRAGHWTSFGCSPLRLDRSFADHQVGSAADCGASSESQHTPYNLEVTTTIEGLGLQQSFARGKWNVREHLVQYKTSGMGSGCTILGPGGQRRSMISNYGQVAAGHGRIKKSNDNGLLLVSPLTIVLRMVWQPVESCKKGILYVRWHPHRQCD